MTDKPRTTIYPRDLLGRDGRQFVLPWGGGRTISTTEAAKRLGVSNHTILRMCEHGELKAWRIRNLPKSPWRVSIESLDAYMEKKLAKYSTVEITPRLGPDRSRRLEPAPWRRDKAVSTVKAAEMLGVSYDTAREMCESGELQGWLIRERKKSHWRVSIESIEQYITVKIASTHGSRQ